jgi:NTE family protein
VGVVRIGLVLGAGGVMGGAWLTGGLEALARETGWDPGSADVIVGTSAGSMMGALVAADIPPWFMVAHSKGEVFDGLAGPDGRAAGDADRSAGATFQLARRFPRIGPGSWGMIASGLARPSSRTATAVICGLLPEGMIENQPLKDTIRRAVSGVWPDHPGLWVVACDYATGRRVPFGRPDAPHAEIGDAVAASCSIPGFYRPVRIAGRRYVDGGVWSTSNLDLLCDDPPDLVICLNPTSSLHPPQAWNPAHQIAHVFRRASGRVLGSEAKLLRAAGAEVVLIQPTDEDHAVMGANLMATRNRNEVIAKAIETVGRQLREPEVQERLRDLPPGEPHKVERPAGPPETWPRIGARA